MRSRWLAYLCVCLSLIFGTAWADGNRIQVDIAPKDLPAALDELAAQADLQMLFDRANVRDKRTPGLKGTYSRREAVERLLAGSGLVYTFTADNAVAIKKPERVAENDTAEAAPKKTGSDEPVVLPEMTVTAKPTDETSYNPPNATTATKTDTPIMETPLSIKVVPQQVLRDQQVIRLDKALQNVSGVYAQPFSIQSGFGDSFNIRGFGTNTQYRNGMPYDGAAGVVGPQETENLERIEVLKGPASILFGRIEPGGLINLVPKQPLDHAYYSLQQQLGSFDFYRTTLDATGPLMEDKHPRLPAESGLRKLGFVSGSLGKRSGVCSPCAAVEYQRPHTGDLRA